MINNIYQKNIEVNDIGKHARRKPRTGGRQLKNQQAVIEAPKKLVEDATKDDSDAKLLQVVHDYLVDMLTNSYCPLAEILFEQMLPE